MRGPTQNLGPIGLAFLTFIGYKRTDRQTSKVHTLLEMTYSKFLCSLYYTYILLISYLISDQGKKNKGVSDRDCAYITVTYLAQLLRSWFLVNPLQC